MSPETLISRALILLAVPIAGMVGLYAFEIGHVVSGSGGSTDGLPPSDLIIGVLCFSILPILILSVGSNAILRWVALVLAGLLTLFHALHVIEHIMVSDWSLSLLILFTMMLPSLLGAILIWRGKAA